MALQETPRADLKGKNERNERTHERATKVFLFQLPEKKRKRQSLRSLQSVCVCASDIKVRLRWCHFRRRCQPFLVYALLALPSTPSGLSPVHGTLLHTHRIFVCFNRRLVLISIDRSATTRPRKPPSSPPFSFASTHDHSTTLTLTQKRASSPIMGPNPRRSSPTTPTPGAAWG